MDVLLTPVVSLIDRADSVEGPRNEGKRSGCEDLEVGERRSELKQAVQARWGRGGIFRNSSGTTHDRLDVEVTRYQDKLFVLFRLWLLLGGLLQINYSIGPAAHNDSWY